MKLFKALNFVIFIIFFIFIMKYYIADNFLDKKKLARKNYKTFLNNKISKMNNIASKKNFKEFQDNSEYFKKNTEEKEFWKLLKKK